MRHISDSERRAKLARRHGLGAAHRYGDVLAAVRAMTALHATEAASVFLALWARVVDVTVGDVEQAMYEDRSLVKQLAMRRTLFVFPREMLPAVWGSAAARTAAGERRRMAKEVESGGITSDGDAWLDATAAAVLDRLADGEQRPASWLREEVPELDRSIAIGDPGKKWGGPVRIGPRVLTLLGAEGRLVRGRNAGHWRLNKPQWTRTEDWLGEPAKPLTSHEGYAAVVASWLRTFGPGTEADLVWWFGATKTAVRHALTAVGAVPVRLDRDETGWVLPGDLDPAEPVEPWAALLPTLDPTVMGWKQRDFYLDRELTPYVFDSNGNAGNTAWWCGRIVGTWIQDEAATVHPRLSNDVDAQARAALQDEADRLTTWLDGVRIANVYKPMQKMGDPLP